MKIMTIVGARPQFIKTAVVSRAIINYNQTCLENTARIQHILVHTGQHYDENMSDIFFAEMHIPNPSYHLGIGESSHGAMTGQMLERIEQLVFEITPDLVLVFGDTNSTLAGSLAAIKLHIPVAHVEAGLRSFNMRMPEEVNRILTDRVSTYLFCPTTTAVANLKREGIDQLSGVNIYNVGDVMYDAVLYYKQIAQPTKMIQDIISCYGTGNYFLTTVHRAENTDDFVRLNNIFRALNEVAATVPIVFPLHPRTRKVLIKFGIKVPHIHFIDPVGYFDMISLLDNCKAVFTDSGGLQKEAFFFQKFCITLRNETEWVELVENGYNVLAGADTEKIIGGANLACRDGIKYRQDLYGNGDAGKKIVQCLTGKVE